MSNFSVKQYKLQYPELSDNEKYDIQLCNISKTDYIGFKPIDVRIKEMRLKGDLTDIMHALDNEDISLNDFFSNSSDVDMTNVPIPALHLKNLDRVEVMQILKQRAEHYSKLRDDYIKSNNSYKGVQSEPPQTESEGTPSADS